MRSASWMPSPSMSVRISRKRYSRVGAGCYVFSVEDTGQWVSDPVAQTFPADVTRGARYLAGALASLDPALGDRWAVRGADGTFHGLDEGAVARLCSGTDLFLNVSGS